MSPHDEGRALGKNAAAAEYNITDAEKDIQQTQNSIQDGPQNVQSEAPYAHSAAAILASGLGSPLPLPPGAKFPPPSGWTGAEAPYASAADVAEWSASNPGGNPGLRLAPDTIGLDVDAYGGKGGDVTMQALVGQLGPLPPTVVSTARGFTRTGDPSGIRLYRVQKGSTARMGDLGPGVELIRPEHRYVVAAPSIHPSGARYEWWDGATGEPLAGPPAVDDLPELPAPWVEHLIRQGRQEKGAKAPRGAGDGSTGPAYADLAEATRGRATAYLERIISDEATIFADVATWPEGQRDEQGRGWEKIAADLANRLGRLERATWTPDAWGWEAMARIVPEHMARAVDLRDVWHRQRDRRDPAPWPTELDHQRVGIEALATSRTSPTMPLQGEAVSPAMFVDRDGLKARRLYEHVIAQGAVGTSPDGEVWTYGQGGWRPGEREVRRRIAAALGDRYRKAHAETVLDLIRAQEPQITDRPETRYLNFRNGMLDLHTGALVPHDPSYYSTNQLAVDWRPEATCPQILAWLAQVLPDATERTVWLELVGYAAYGDNPLHKAALLDGGGRNGKGTTLRIITALLGRDNIAAVPPQKLDSDRWAAADLFGVLANLAGDVSPRSFTETETFKQVTGGDLIRAERKHRDAFKFVSRAFLIGSFNRLPTSADHSEGFFSRWVVLPFRAQIAEADEHGNVPAGTIRKDASVEDRLLTHAELEGLAVLAVGALRSLLARGAFTETSAGREAAQEFRRHADPLRGFLAEAVSPAPSCHIARTDLYKAYLRWCGENQIKARGRNNFNADLRALHVETFGFAVDERKTNGVEVWSGLELAASYYRQSGVGP